MQRARAWLITGLLLAMAGASGAEDGEKPIVYPTIPSSAPAAAGFVPPGWVSESESRGDLDGDGVADLLLVLRMNDPRNLVKEEEAGAELDTNPHLLVIALASEGGSYRLALADHRLIPRHLDRFRDPPFEAAAIVKGTVQVSLGLFMSAGGWYTSKVKLTFRFQDGCFQLIGYDSRVLRRNTGEIESVSLNYLTKKAKLVRGQGDSDRETVSWKTLQASGLQCLEAVGDGLDFQPEIRPFP